MQNIFSFLKNKYFKFGVAITIYILWVIWMGNYWFLLGAPIVFDIYVSKKVNWTPWKKRNAKNSTIIEWIDALIFAVVAVTVINIFLFQNYKIPTGSMEKTLLIGDHLYVSKVSYGPRLPNTPLAFPFAQNTLWDDVPSFLTWIQMPYKRLAGLDTIKNDDIVVFNFPEGDTVLFESPAQSYYGIITDEMERLRQQDVASNVKRSESEYYSLARERVNKGTILVRPVDRTDNYIKRCVAIPGDSLQLIDGNIYINGKPQKDIAGMQHNYRIETDGLPFNEKVLADMGIASSDNLGSDGVYYYISLSKENAVKIKEFSNVKSMVMLMSEKGAYDYRVFPHDPQYAWNQDNFGPLYIPRKGATINISKKNISIYGRIIGHYEKNNLEVKDSVILINGKPATTYTFKMNYFFMIGDNRHNSLDSRFWGFVPEDHVIGKPIFIWLSLDQDKSFPSNIRWSRMFTMVRP